jgi:3-oxoadipate enol-lactonase
MRLFSTPAVAIAAGCLLLGGVSAQAAPRLIPVADG